MPLISRTSIPAMICILMSVCSVANAVEPASATELPITGRADPKLTAFDEVVSTFVRERKIPGAAIAVTKNGRLVYARGFGYADIEQKQPVQPESLFRIASISKPITAVAILQLIEQGKLKLDDRCFEILKVEPYLPEGKHPDPRLKDITVRHLMQHTGGWDRDKSFDAMFRSVEFARVLGAEPPAGPWHVIRYMAGHPLDFDPGERYAYSNLGYCLLGRIIEKVSGQPYDEYVCEHVLKPVGVTRMRIGKTLSEGRADGEVRYYETTADGEVAKGPSVFAPHLGELVPQPYGAWHLEAMDAHGGWLASAVDLVKFASAFDDRANSKLLRGETIGTMFTRPTGLAGYDKDGNPRPLSYGCGWMLTTVGETGRVNQWHTGSLPGTSTILVRRHDGLNWAVLFNTRNDARKEVPSRTIEPLIHQAADAVKEWPEIDRFPEFR